jgi:hypothetical protein
MACRRALPVLAAAALLAVASCSKTQDTAPDPMRFGTAPLIESVNQGGSIPLTTQEVLRCDFTRPFDALLYADGPFEDYCDLNDLHQPPSTHAGYPKRKTRRVASYRLGEGVTQIVGGSYTAARFEVQVSDADSTPEQDNVLLVTASFVMNAGTAQAQEISLVVLDDGSQNLFDYTQKAGVLQGNCEDVTETTPEVTTCRDVVAFDEGGNPICPTPEHPTAEFKNCEDPASPTPESCEPCTFDLDDCNTCLFCETTPAQSITYPKCEIAKYQLTTNDTNRDDHIFSRGFAFFNLRLSFLAEGLLQDCIAREKHQAPFPTGGAQTFEFTIEAVDRQGNVDDWGDKPRASVSTDEFFCEGDECLCCWIRTGSFDGECAGKEGIRAPEDPDGKCVNFSENPRAYDDYPRPGFFDDARGGGCFFP